MLCQDRFLNWKWRELSENRTPEGQGCFVRSDSPWTRTVDAESQKHEPTDKLITRQLVRISDNLLSVFRKYRLGCVNTSINNVPVSDGSGPTAMSPNRLKSQPPRTPPIIPTIRFSQNPDPLPLTIRLATYPATSPMSIYQRKYIIGGFKLYISYSNSYATTCRPSVKPICSGYVSFFMPGPCASPVQAPLPRGGNIIIFVSHEQPDQLP